VPRQREFRFQETNAPKPIIAEFGGATSEGFDVLQRRFQIAFFEFEANASVFVVRRNP